MFKRIIDRLIFWMAVAVFVSAIIGIGWLLRPGPLAVPSGMMANYWAQYEKFAQESPEKQ